MSERQKRAKSRSRPNRAQRRAQEVRAAESNVPAPLDLTVTLDQVEIVGSSATASSVAARRGTRRTATAPAYVLPRDVEYAYIRSDMRRLLLTAGALLMLMFVLLFILD